MQYDSLAPSAFVDGESLEAPTPTRSPESDDHHARELIPAIAGGDILAFERLYRRYERRVRDYALTFTRDYATADEVVVDTMTTVWRDAKHYGGAAKVSSWILGIARHKAIDAVRKARRSPLLNPLEESDDIEDESATPFDWAARSADVARLNTALALLSDEHREALRLAFVEELPYGEIAHLAAIPENTVKTRVFHAKRRLQRLLAEIQD